MDVTVVGLFLNADDAKQAVATLQDAGCPPNSITVMAKGDGESPETTDEIDEVEENPPGNETLNDAMAGGVLGGILGLLAGVTSVILPGSLIVLGPLAGLLGGAALGATAGTVVGAFRDLGISEDEAHGYMTSIDAGAVLVAVHVDEHDTADPERILNEAGARDVHVVYPNRDD